MDLQVTCMGKKSNRAQGEDELVSEMVIRRNYIYIYIYIIPLKERHATYLKLNQVVIYSCYLEPNISISDGSTTMIICKGLGEGSSGVL